VRKIGTEVFGKAKELGNAELTDARAECSKA